MWEPLRRGFWLKNSLNKVAVKLPSDASLTGLLFQLTLGGSFVRGLFTTWLPQKN